MKQCAVAIFVLLWLAPTMGFAQSKADAGQHDVPWTTNASTYANTALEPVAATLQFVYCRGMDVDWRKLATTEVFEATLPPGHDVTHHQALSRYAVDFGASVVAADAGADDRPLCIASDTRAEADKSRRDYRNAFLFARIKTIDMAWTPGQTPLVVPAAAALATPVAATVATMGVVVEDGEPGDWHRISDSQRIEDFDDYLVAYPQGRHAAIARLEAKRLRQEVVPPRVAANEPVIAMETKNDAAKHLPQEVALPPVIPSEPVVAMAIKNDAAKHLPQEVAPLRVTPSEPGVALSAKDDAAALAQPGDAALAKRIATEPFFQVPVGSGAIATRTGMHIVNETVPVASRITARRVAGGNLCQLDYNSDAGAGATFKTKAAGVTWAGLIPLQLASQINSPYALISGTNRTLTIDTAEGQPFPLVEGHTFAYSYTQSNVDDAIGTTTMTLAQDCKVGATGPASATIPGMAGAQTEVHCRMRFGNAAIPPQDSVMHWYSAVGCFVQDPAR